MVVSDVKIKLVRGAEQKLLAFACITLDGCFVVRDIKVIQGHKSVFIAMPSRKLMQRCTFCSYKNPVQGRYCNQCGHGIEPVSIKNDKNGRAKLHADIAHPINGQMRKAIHEAVYRSYMQEVERSQAPGYVVQNDDDFMDGPEDIPEINGNGIGNGNGIEQSDSSE